MDYAEADLRLGGPGTPPRDDVAFVASSRTHPGDPDAEIELRQTTDGRLALLAFTSLDALVSGCGSAQPWIAFPTDRLDDVVEASGAGVVLWDITLDPDRRHREN